MLPELLPLGEFSKVKHSDYFVIEPSSETNFSLHCKVSSDTLAKCQKIHYRWLKNGAYKPDSDGKKVKKKCSKWNAFIFSVLRILECFSRFLIQNILGDFQETSRADKIPSILNWLGKVSCEVFCFSTGKIYQSEEIILALQQFLTLQIDFTFKTLFVSLPAMEEYLKNEMQNGVCRMIFKRREEFELM